MTQDGVIEEIISRNPQISKNEILNRLNELRKRTNGLISNNVLLRTIAAELGMEISKEELKTRLSTQDLVTGLNNVTIAGRVVAMFRPRTYKGKEKEVANFFISDDKGILRVVLWDNKTELIKQGKIRHDQIIRVHHGYTRKGYWGEVELHVGDNGEIDISPMGIEERMYPTISRFITKIGEISETHKNKRIHVEGIVSEIFPISDFERADSSSGKLMRIILSDETGVIPVVIWNEKADELHGILEQHMRIRLINVKVNEGLKKGYEIHVNSQTYVEIA
ncbi:MAG: OB-fold nucleic acid binding domain-containing protein [Candidatus Bathyarchaeota archaeon]|jgi:replication factor A1